MPPKSYNDSRPDAEPATRRAPAGSAASDHTAFVERPSSSAASRASCEAGMENRRATTLASAPAASSRVAASSSSPPSATAAATPPPGGIGGPASSSERSSSSSSPGGRCDLTKVGAVSTISRASAAMASSRSLLLSAFLRADPNAVGSAAAAASGAPDASAGLCCSEAEEEGPSSVMTRIVRDERPKRTRLDWEPTLTHSCSRSFSPSTVVPYVDPKSTTHSDASSFAVAKAAWRREIVRCSSGTSALASRPTTA
mmetsp:Transcript_14904/g.59761  ORF Transcript_14904/g.59761 Transcript_14904/m.59761 type:complete len:256 (+) Transcript_14904:1661-2428(+)